MKKKHKENSKLKYDGTKIAISEAATAAAAVENQISDDGIMCEKESKVGRVT